MITVSLSLINKHWPASKFLRNQQEKETQRGVLGKVDVRMEVNNKRMKK